MCAFCSLHLYRVEIYYSLSQYRLAADWIGRIRFRAKLKNLKFAKWFEEYLVFNFIVMFNYPEPAQPAPPLAPPPPLPPDHTPPPSS